MNIRIKIADNKTETDQSRILLLLPSEGEATAEDLAMLQALYSRDPRPIDDALKAAKASKSGEFMQKFYVGYGHASIADCGNITLAIENVPMIIAKLIQQNPLYRGQECSTRYLDFSKQQMLAENEESRIWQEKLRSFYMKYLPVVEEEMYQKHNLDKTLKADQNTAKACAFDIMRGFLPIGACTNLSWTTDLRNFNDHVARLRSIQDSYYGLKDLLDKMVKLVHEEFPNSIFESRDDGTIFYSTHNSNGVSRTPFSNSFNIIEWKYDLDFASWRDIARHRSIRQSMPVFPTSSQWKIHPFYMSNLPDEAIEEFITGDHFKYEMPNSILNLPMGVMTKNYAVGFEDKFNYIMKLRSTHMVHPTLRTEIIRLARELGSIDLIREENRTLDWKVSSKRGTQTIERK